MVKSPEPDLRDQKKWRGSVDDVSGDECGLGNDFAYRPPHHSRI